MKVMESALYAVAKGSAGKSDIQIATNSATVEVDGKVIHASLHEGKGESRPLQNETSHWDDRTRKGEWTRARI